MKTEIKFVLNNELITAEANPTMSLLDFLRNEKHLTGVKSVCREGDCGACSVLIGRLDDSEIKYQSITSCIYPLGNAAGKHIVTIEGLNQPGLNFIQYHFAEENAAQCGFCTPGYIISLTAFMLNNSGYSYEEAEKAVAGNVCRCTGYGSIKRALHNMTDEMSVSSEDFNQRLKTLIDKKVIPEYFVAIPQMLENIVLDKVDFESEIVIGGGTDLYVQKPDELHALSPLFVEDSRLDYIKESPDSIIIGGGTTFEEIADSEIINKFFPSFKNDSVLIASKLIRNVATLAGNIVNASPIGDMTIIFLALNAELKLKINETERIVPIRNFYLGYKNIDKEPMEIIEEIIIPKPSGNTKFNFEKVSKRTHLDIASVNSSILIETNNETIVKAAISAGGVAPVPKYLEKTSAFLIGKEVSNEIVLTASESAMNEITPIDDVRGSAEYKKLLLGQLIKAHFAELFPEKINIGELL